MRTGGSCQNGRGLLRFFQLVAYRFGSYVFWKLSQYPEDRSKPRPFCHRVTVRTEESWVGWQAGWDMVRNFPVLVLIPENELTKFIDQMGWKIRNRSQLD